MSSYWYVLTHPSPAQIEWMLQRENLGDFRRKDEPALEPLEYFIPFQFLLRAPVSTPPSSVTEDYIARDITDLMAEENNGLREALHSYIFIHASENRITQLLESEWNRTGRLHLFQYRNSSGEPLRVLDDEMRRFIDTLRNRQLRYYIGQPINAIEVGDTVTLNIAPWEGHQATITRLEVRSGKTRLTVTLDVLGNLTRVTFPDIQEGDIIFDDESLGRLINGNLLSNFEQEMVSILGRRFGRKPTDEDRHRTQTRRARLYGYHGVILDRVDDQRRFMALMLICASLLGEAEAKQSYVKQMQEWLGGRTEPADATEAYLILALFVALRDPVFRDVIKNYKNSHDDCPEIIRQLFSKVKRLRCR